MPDAPRRRSLATDAKYVGAYRAWAGLAARDSRLAEVDRQIVDWSADRLAGILAVARDAPAGRRDLDVPVTARLLTLLFRRLVLSRTSTPSAPCGHCPACSVTCSSPTVRDGAGAGC